MVSLLGNMVLAASFISLFPLPSITIISWQSITVAIATAFMSWGYSAVMVSTKNKSIIGLYLLKNFKGHINRSVLFMDVWGQDILTLPILIGVPFMQNASKSKTPKVKVSPNTTACTPATAYKTPKETHIQLTRSMTGAHYTHQMSDTQWVIRV